jgi:hypothetical protein
MVDEAEEFRNERFKPAAPVSTPAIDLLGEPKSL